MKIVEIVMVYEKISLELAICFLDDVIEACYQDLLIMAAEDRAVKLENDQLMNHRKNYRRSNWLHNIKKTTYKKGGYRASKEKGQKRSNNLADLIWSLT